MELAALSHDANQHEMWALPDVTSHPLWCPTVHRHCASRQDWLGWQSRDLEAKPDEVPTGGVRQDGVSPGWREVPATLEGWSTFRNAVDRVHHQLTTSDVSTLGSTVTGPEISTWRSEPDAPFARAGTSLVAYLRLDHDDGVCAIELEEEPEVIGVEPGSLVVASGYRRHRVLGEGTLLRFGVNVPALARPVRPDCITGADGPVDDVTAFYIATAVPLTAPAPSSEIVEQKSAELAARRRRQYRHNSCPVVRAYLVDGADPGLATDDELAVIRSYGTTSDATVNGSADIVRRVPLFDSQQCERLIAFGRDHMRAVVLDSVDDLPEYQVNLDVASLTDLVGPAPVDELLSLPAAHGADEAVPDEVLSVSLFLRIFSPETRPYITFHSDVSRWTVNVPLDDDGPDGGGRLLMLYAGALREEARLQGVALSHPGAVVHAVSRVKAGQRWSLIALFHASDPSGPVEEGRDATE
jgi:hypothetical protein